MTILAEQFLWALQLSIVFCMVALTVLLFFKLCGSRFSARCRCLVWTFLIIRLVIPFGVGASPVLNYVIPESITVSADAGDGETASGDDISVEGGTSLIPGVPVVSDPDEGVLPSSVPSVMPGGEEDKNIDIKPAAILSAVGTAWLLGAMTFLSVHMGSYFVFLLKLKRGGGLSMPDDRLSELYSRACSEVNVKAPPRLMVCTNGMSPMYFGYFRRTVLIPDTVIGETETLNVLKHELVHCRRRDVWVKLICCIGQAVHWFNPLVHVASSALRFELEMSCDDEVLRGLGEDDRIAYGETMLNVIRNSTALRASSMTTSFTPGFGFLRRRIDNIADGRVKYRGSAVAVVFLALLIAAGSLVSFTVAASEVMSDDVTPSDNKAEFTDDTSSVRDTGPDDEGAIPEETDTSFDVTDETEPATYETVIDGGETNGSDSAEKEDASETEVTYETEPEEVLPPVESAPWEEELFTEAHPYVYSATVDNGCTEKVKYEYVCSHCGDVIYYTSDVKGSCKYILISESAPTCAGDGVKVYSCSICSDSYSETSSALEHSYVEASCTSPKVCSVCGATDGAPKGHKFTAPTTERPMTCSVCGMNTGLKLPDFDKDSAPETEDEKNGIIIDIADMQMGNSSDDTLCDRLEYVGASDESVVAVYAVIRDPEEGTEEKVFAGYAGELDSDGLFSLILKQYPDVKAENVSFVFEEVNK